MPCMPKREPPPLTENQKIILAEIEMIADFMDQTWITFCGKNFGADGIIGLIPVVGDMITTTVSWWIMIRVYFAFDRSLRRKVCAMMMNVCIDLTLGSIPFFGDIFDVYWKSNKKNINLVRKHYGMEPLPENGEEPVPKDDPDAEDDADQHKETERSNSSIQESQKLTSNKESLV